MREAGSQRASERASAEGAESPRASLQRGRPAPGRLLPPPCAIAALSCSEPRDGGPWSPARGGRAAGGSGGEGKAAERRLGPPPGTGTGRARRGRGRRRRCGCRGEGRAPGTRTLAPRALRRAGCCGRLTPPPGLSSRAPRSGESKLLCAGDAGASPCASCSTCKVVGYCFSQVWAGESRKRTFYKGVLGAPAACALLCQLPGNLGPLIQSGVLCQAQVRAGIGDL